MRIKIQPYHTSLNTKKFALKTLLSATLLCDAILPYRTDRTERQNTSLAGWVIWMQKWNGSISTSDFYRTNVFILKHSHCSKQLTSLCLNSKSQICQNWKWIHFILHSIDSAREASENTFAVRQLEFSANITIVHGATLPVSQLEQGGATALKF